jgi:hypothetical protein
MRTQRAISILAGLGALANAIKVTPYKRGDQYGDLLEKGVIHPKVIRTALPNAAGVAGLMLTTEARLRKTPKTPNQAKLRRAKEAISPSELFLGSGGHRSVAWQNHRNHSGAAEQANSGPATKAAGAF